MHLAYIYRDFDLVIIYSPNLVYIQGGKSKLYRGQCKKLRYIQDGGKNSNYMQGTSNLTLKQGISSIKAVSNLSTDVVIIRPREI